MTNPVYFPQVDSALSRTTTAYVLAYPDREAATRALNPPDFSATELAWAAHDNGRVPPGRHLDRVAPECPARVHRVPIGPALLITLASDPTSTRTFMMHFVCGESLARYAAMQA